MSDVYTGPRLAKWLAILASGLLLTSCAADQYFMVEKRDISQLHQSVSAQNRQIAELETEITTSLDSTATLNNTNTRSILAAISKQAENFTCPPVPRQPACNLPSAETEATPKGHADRLKGKVIVGEVERFYLVGPGLVHVARIDSGAETSSLDARNITRFERDGNNWVRFDVPMPDSDGFITLEREVSRRVRIIQSSTDEVDRRVVVELQFMIGDHHQQAEFTLTNREHLSHTVLVGRNILRDVMLIDVGKEFATELPSPLPNQASGELP